eukprot:CAMPEP_0198520666 /NCGR_PEP_ID=MMETSP1462-20131121/20467_1 /TAXON_ID=1333877 /ORGANISM="Brandtodinium nutriculum, Strain RCC3387" /LENGTH=57 /DNA_ID=CAMNT_0044250295 /DNA_START=448 /DNA_END=618 /DNA_ORIENTATION=-
MAQPARAELDVERLRGADGPERWRLEGVGGSPPTGDFLPARCPFGQSFRRFSVSSAW